MSDRLEYKGLDLNGQAITVKHIDGVRAPTAGLRFWGAVRAMYAYCRDGHGHPCGRFYSAHTAIRWARHFR